MLPRQGAVRPRGSRYLRRVHFFQLPRFYVGLARKLSNGHELAWYSVCWGVQRSFRYGLYLLGKRYKCLYFSAKTPCLLSNYPKTLSTWIWNVVEQLQWDFGNGSWYAWTSSDLTQKVKRWPEIYPICFHDISELSKYFFDRKKVLKPPRPPCCRKNNGF